LEGAGGARGVLAVLKDAASWKAVAADTLGNVLALAGVNGDFTRRTFDPWGNPLVRDASGSLRAATLTERRADYDALPLAWASQEYDPDTGLTHYHFREYSPSLGGWLTRDPIGLAGGYLNLRSYLGNRPADELDVWGLFKSNKHIGITMKALAKTGLSSKCIKIITKANEDQDRGAGTDWIDYPFKEDSPFSDPRNHGDDNRIEETIQLMSSRLRSVSISRCDECKDSYQALREIGKVFHALQDLYSHSTYVETFGEYSESVSELKTWKMWKNDGTPNVPQGVISGSYSYPFDDDEGERTHKHLNKDNEKSERGKLHNAYRHSYYTLAEDVATRATEELWNEIWNGLSSGQKEGIMKCCAGK
jgi:RHS repeat-associated protein